MPTPDLTDDKKLYGEVKEVGEMPDKGETPLRQKIGEKLASIGLWGAVAGGVFTAAHLKNGLEGPVGKSALIVLVTSAVMNLVGRKMTEETNPTALQTKKV